MNEETVTAIIKSEQHITVPEGIPVALFCIAMVFAVLAILFTLIKLFSLVVAALEGNGKKSENSSAASDETVSFLEEQAEFSSGELKLYNVDERTAAMVMAIVSDESGIPLAELCFKSIKEKV